MARASSKKAAAPASPETETPVAVLAPAVQADQVAAALAAPPAEPANPAEQPIEQAAPAESPAPVEPEPTMAAPQQDEDSVAAEQPDAPELAETTGAVAVSSLQADVHEAVTTAINKLQTLATFYQLSAITPAERALASIATAGVVAIQDAFRNTDAQLRTAIGLQEYEGQPRRTFPLLKDVLLDNEPYGPGAERKSAPLTEAQHAELKAAGAVTGAWEDGEQ